MGVPGPSVFESAVMVFHRCLWYEIMEYAINRLVLALAVMLDYAINRLASTIGKISNCAQIFAICTALTAELKKRDKRLVKQDMQRNIAVKFGTVPLKRDGWHL